MSCVCLPPFQWMMSSICSRPAKCRFPMISRCSNGRRTAWLLTSTAKRRVGAAFFDDRPDRVTDSQRRAVHHRLHGRAALAHAAAPGKSCQLRAALSSGRLWRRQGAGRDPQLLSGSMNGSTRALTHQTSERRRSSSKDWRGGRRQTPTMGPQGTAIVQRSVRPLVPAGKIDPNHDGGSARGEAESGSHGSGDPHRSV
jgi:hypothetical protein